MDGYNRENFYKSKNSGLYLSKSLMKPFKDFINTEGKTKEQRASLEISLLDILLFDSDDEKEKKVEKKKEKKEKKVDEKKS